MNFRQLLESLFQAPPRRILMEASGLADPRKLRAILGRFAEYIGREKIIVLLDAGLWEAREVMGNALQTQLSAADLVLLNKIDLFEPGRVDQFLEEIATLFPQTGLLPTTFGRVDAEIFFAAPSRQKSSTLFLPDQTFMAGYQTFSHEHPGVVKAALFNDFIREHGPAFERIKGQVNLDTGPAYFDYVRGRSDWRPPLTGLAGSRLVFIGKNIDGPHLGRLLRSMSE